MSVRDLASELELRPAQVESMVDFWINKGRIRVSTNLSECGSCSVQGECPFILEMPRTFELVNDHAHNQELVSRIPCNQK